jgi:hypothetical protein
MLSVEILQHKKKILVLKGNLCECKCSILSCFCNGTCEAQVSELWNSLALSDYHNAVIWKVWNERDRDLCYLVSVLKR